MSKYFFAFNSYKLALFLMPIIFILAEKNNFFNNFFCKNKFERVYFMSLQVHHVYTRVATDVYTNNKTNQIKIYKKEKFIIMAKKEFKSKITKIGNSYTLRIKKGFFPEELEITQETDVKIVRALDHIKIYPIQSKEGA